LLCLFPITFMLTCLIPATGFACPYSIRDAGFVELEPARYGLYCLVRDDTPQKDEIATAFEEVAAAVLLDSNIWPEVVNVDEQESHPVNQHVNFWNVKTFPAVIMVAEGCRSLALPPLSADEPLKGQAWSLLESAVSSPKRDELMQHAAKAWCTVLLVEGEDAAENQRARESVAEAGELITGAITPMGRVIQEGPQMVVVSSESSAEEKVLLWSLGLDKSDGARAAVLYGRGRQMGPVLEGEYLTKDFLLDIFYAVGLDCGCQTDSRLLAGRVVPLRWGTDIQTEVAANLGFDPESPMVKTEVSRLWPGGASFVQEPLEYSEGVFEYGEEEAVDLEEDAPVEEVASELPIEASALTLGERAGKSVLFIGGGLVLLVLVGTGVIIVKRAS
jgi:hypothetical protein